MKKTILSFILILSFNVLAKDQCTDQPKEKWMSESDFKRMAESQGYKIRKFKTPGSCYEIYGTDIEGRNIEIYFNPVDGSVVKSKSLTK